ncbi:hypothetical protein BFL34_01462 [Clavibacter michiganensis]|uniref:Alpha/beta hydrolase n=1 Tax=Clavibacter michiganensis TaxID=28447 RepID=A0A251Y8Q8_9MICO|nr:hypothetical protein [Clavibacter michiganensis]OUE20644.1 hypothetical protein BFL34_01462 [Clavibacter michiganensis]
MTTTLRLGPVPTAVAPVALVLPGAGYTVLGPLLHWPVRALTEAGWDVWLLDWHADVDEAARRDPAGFVTAAVEGALAELPADPAAVVAKSLGTHALPLFTGRAVRGVWLAPLLGDPAIASAAAGASRRHLLVGGSADPAWITGFSGEGGARVREMPGGDHGLIDASRGWRASAAAQLEILDEVVAHLTDV